MMQRVWYVHKFFLGQWKGFLRVPGWYDAADKLHAMLSRKYSRHGWQYEVSGDRHNPRSSAYGDRGAGI